MLLIDLTRHWGAMQIRCLTAMRFPLSYEMRFLFLLSNMQANYNSTFVANSHSPQHLAGDVRDAARYVRRLG